MATLHVFAPGCSNYEQHFLLGNLPCISVLSKPCLGVLSGNNCDHADSGLEDCGRCKLSSQFGISTAKGRISAKVMIALSCVFRRVHRLLDAWEI
ncbi:unnamed protein product [Cladocopium goreaui]|uniref:Uncharacterized protein n=1 Tax=Cladocopium goreaui TaxID=2562237 RepID=A0A9P1CE54_9DINO|nr:unnamed protein product [Cladocopium goreaui]